MASLGGGRYNDSAAASLHHRRGESTNGVRGSRKIHIDLNMPVRVFHLEQRPEGLNPRIRKKNVNSSEVMLDLYSCGAKSCQVALVDHEALPIAARRLDELSRLV